MGRNTDLLYFNSYVEPKNHLYIKTEGSEEVCHKIDINKFNELNDSLSGWKMINDNNVIYIVPEIDEMEEYTCNWGGRVQCICWNDFPTKSSEEYIKNFEGYYFDSSFSKFPYIEENIINNLAKFLKQNFNNGFGAFVIKDELISTVINYTIRFILKNDEVKFAIEIMNFDNSLNTVRFELNY